MPLLFIIFNRPDTTAKVFERIRAARPTKLYVAADGPRPGRADDEENCRLTRQIVDKGIDWPCEVKKNYRDKNLGCRAAVSSAITWFFENEEAGIILEDDCLPEPSFFPFAEECLEKYKNDTRVMHINGSNYQGGWQRDPQYSYYFSKLNSIWGWASWRRAWKHYDLDMKTWPEVKSKRRHYDFSLNRMDAVNREQIFDIAYNKQIDTWDYQWTYAIMSNSGLCIVPNVNLISNIGFGGEATHTTTGNKRSALLTKPVKLPLAHPPYVIPDTESDNRVWRVHSRRGWLWRIRNFRRLIS